MCYDALEILDIRRTRPTTATRIVCEIETFTQLPCDLKWRPQLLGGALVGQALFWSFKVQFGIFIWLSFYFFVYL